ncbi:unnamed protein product [Caenorhabditis angaria]|uniref:N-acetylgalactosaminide beta-1,3-galactosyltransferase n=1 Tax=Caenorhabditis angaria TaxID=860376 RepID=A0A9P1IVN2_9PELO|nr:unnamed protein product [Caenorhabditis angaria]
MYIKMRVLKIREISPNFEKYLLVDEYSEVNFDNFENFGSENIFIGYALKDKEPTIIHHFGFNLPESFEYPLLSSGILLSADIVNRIEKTKSNMKLPSFFIDAQHELAEFLYTNLQIKLTHFPESFCTFSNKIRSSKCFVTSQKSLSISTISEDDIHIKIKTHHGNHKTRIPIQKKTWTSNLKNLEYCSDFEDISIPTIDLKLGNTQRGHCAKTWGIMKRFNGSKWLLIADDDTLISWSRLKIFLSKYNPEDRVIIGERYGYGFDYDGNRGYDYPTGGSGMIFSESAIKSLLAVCPNCSSPDDPDDMMIGMCAQLADIPIIHSKSLHQARPEDYAEEYLDSQFPISFHKFTDTDPIKNYEMYLKTDKINDEL